MDNSLMLLDNIIVSSHGQKKAHLQIAFLQSFGTMLLECWF